MTAMSLAMRRLLLLLVVTAISVAGLPTHAAALLLVGDGPVQEVVEQHAQQHAGARHDHEAGGECVEAGHCFAVQLIFCPRIDAVDVVQRGFWGRPGDIRGSSLKPEASTPPPRAA